MAKPYFTHNYYASLTKLIVLIAFSVIILGVYARLSSHISVCENWPYCSNNASTLVLSKPDASKVTRAILTGYRATHNYMTGSLGLLALGLLVWSWLRRRRYEVAYPLLLPSLIVLLVSLEILLGIYPVTVHHVPIVAATHLLCAFLIAGLLWWLGLRTAIHPFCPASPELRLLKPWAVIGLAIIIVQLILGSWANSHYASPNCPAGFASCGPYWQSAGYYYDPYTFLTRNHINVQMLHRFGAYLSIVYLIPFTICLLALPGKKNLQPLGAFLLIIIGCEFILGTFTALWSYPLVIAVAHACLAGVLLLTMLTIVYRLSVPLDQNASLTELPGNGVNVSCSLD